MIIILIQGPQSHGPGGVPSSPAVSEAFMLGFVFRLLKS